MNIVTKCPICGEEQEGLESDLFDCDYFHKRVAWKMVGEVLEMVPVVRVKLKDYQK